MAIPQTFNPWMCALLLGIGVLLSNPGCQTAPEPVVERVEAPPPPPEPALRAMADTHLTLFGEFPGRERVPFQARAASPAQQHTAISDGADFDVRVSPDGRMLVFASTRHASQPEIYIKAVDGQAITQVVADPAADVQPTFSPDGKRICFASNRSGNWDLWMVSLDGGQPVQITHSPQHEVHPSFSPDGKRLVYCMFNDRSDTWELWTLALDAPGSRRMIGVGLFPEWSPKGDSIIYQRARERGGRWFSIWRIDLKNGEPGFPQELAASSSMALIQPTWSPDGAWIAYGTARLETPAAASAEPASGMAAATPSSDLEQTRGDIWIMQANGTSAVQLTDGAGAYFGPAWSCDGRVYFTSRQNATETIWSVRPTGIAAPQTPVASVDTIVEPAAGQANRARIARGQGG